MLASVIFLSIHAFLPILRVPKPLTMAGMSDYLFDQDFIRLERVLKPDEVQNNQ
tara:strand:+ start:732 stop:893 length:162 start_codon:yes stop_codon:yes gene_type:complete